MDVSETAVSRDERDEYHGITVERARKVIDALGVRSVTRVEVGQPAKETARGAKAVRKAPIAPAPTLRR